MNWPFIMELHGREREQRWMIIVIQNSFYKQ